MEISDTVAGGPTATVTSHSNLTMHATSTTAFGGLGAAYANTN
jgi:hypothetical protein